MLSGEEKENRMERVLITGASGFVGGHLAEQLVADGVSVRALVRDPSKLPSGIATRCDIVQGDVLDESLFRRALENIDTVFHLAAILGPSHLSIARYRSVNAGSVDMLMRLSRSIRTIRRIVLVSTVGVLGPLNPREIACEGTPPRPENRYEVTKLEGEEIALAASRDGLPVVIARPAWVYGPCDTRTLKLFRMIARRRFAIVGSAQNRQHPIWIGDLIEGLVRCGTTPGIEGRVYHLAGPEIMTVESLCEQVAEAAGVRIPRFRIPLRAVLIPAYTIEWLFKLLGGEPPVDHRKVDFFRVNRAYSIDRARKDLGWEPTTLFRDGIARTLAWYRQNGKL